VNHFLFRGQVLACEPLRYTPAGLPVLEMTLTQAIDVVEAGVARRLALTLAAVALGDVALMLTGTPLGVTVQVEGFLAPTRKGASRLKLHVQQARRVHGTEPMEQPLLA